MELRALKDLVKKGEGQQLEFKHKAAFPEKIVREMVAFANTDGGHVLIGVDDDGKIPGLKFAEEERFVLEEAIKLHARPRFKYNSELIAISRKRSVIRYNILESKIKPTYFIENNQKRGKAYVRVEDKSLQASREIVEILKGRSNRKPQKIHFGEKEKLLMEYIDKHGSITLSEFQSLANIPRKTASRTLVILVLSNVLNVNVREKEDSYFVKQDF
jgi:predicted HTH transcriptional regulator